MLSARGNAQTGADPAATMSALLASNHQPAAAAAATIGPPGAAAELAAAEAQEDPRCMLLVADLHMHLFGESCSAASG
jgi:hypothetical protein